ncbi:M56 family metallopeptidase [Microbispora sp. NBC_01189]|uniref:M56 family metallopeptidase n=1 Tax=Microbispora sp. NBC_01189 TaxID=2903583 RepID=UPI002E15F675|nr:M56 family metallopeptidase [Microbispora sp. NBC_01189]
MAWLVWSPLVANLVLGLLGPWIARTLPPRVAVRLVPIAMVAVALGTATVLAALGFLSLAQTPQVALLGDWSAGRLGDEQPWPVAAEAIAGACAAILLAAGLITTVRVVRDLARAAGAARRLAGGTDGVVIIPDTVPDAYALPALPGTPGRVVVTTAMLRALDGDERRVVFAHEAAHVSHRHHMYIQLARLASASNPLLRPTAHAVRFAVERAADEAAAGQVGSRQLTARALARAALAKAAALRAAADVDGPDHGSTGMAHVVLPVTDGQVALRAAALLAPAPRPHRAVAVGLLLLTVVTLVGASAAVDQLDDRLDQAGMPSPRPQLAAPVPHVPHL